MVSLSDLSQLATVLGGIPIPGCGEGSAAQRAGLRYGDVLLSIDGRPTASWADFFQARQVRTGQPTVRVFRQGTEFDVSLDLPSTSRCPRHVLETLRQRELPPRTAKHMS
jgi:S1-C subfamily serine protease